MPRSGMNGTPFSAAWKAACSAGQVASFIRMVADVTAAVKRGAAPNSPRPTADVSSTATQPAPIMRSACRLEVGSATRWRLRTPRRINARVASIGTPATSRGTASMMPSRIGASASSIVCAITGMGYLSPLPQGERSTASVSEPSGEGRSGNREGENPSPGFLASLVT